jgi:hypothetical protein
MDISEQLEEQKIIEENRMKKTAGLWNPTTKERQIAYHSWLTKQANQRQKTLDDDSVTHSRPMKDLLKRQKRMYEEEANRVKDLIEDGR